MDGRRLRDVALLYISAIASGYAMFGLRVPLPWMIGPMVVSAVAGLAGRNPGAPPITRPVGQLVVASSVGMFFTPAAVNAVVQHVGSMVGAALLTILAGFVAAAVLTRLARVDPITASLSGIPGGPVDMAALAAQHDAQPGIVAFAQSLRIALLVLIIPPLLVAFDGTVTDPTGSLDRGAAFDLSGIGLLLVLAVCGGIFMRFVRVASPFFLGPLAASAAASAMVLPISAPPYVALAGAQVLLGAGSDARSTVSCSPAAAAWSPRSSLRQVP